MARTWALLLGVQEGGGGVHACRSSVWLWDTLHPFLTSCAPHGGRKCTPGSVTPSDFREAGRLEVRERALVRGVSGTVLSVLVPGSRCLKMERGGHSHVVQFSAGSQTWRLCPDYPSKHSRCCQEVP